MELGKLQIKWLNELESGKHKQTVGCMNDQNGHCCLGVCAEFVLDIKPVLVNDDSGWYSFDENDETLTRYDEIGLYDATGQFRENIMINGIEYESLANLNDNDFTFAQIAKIIRDNPENVFMEPR